MKTGTVVGSVWATKRVDRLPAGALLEVELDGGERIVAFDTLGSGEGESVLVTFGQAAVNALPDGRAIVDAVIVAALDETPG